MINPIETGRRIRRLRTQILDPKLSQSDLAERIGGVTRGAVGNWELGKGIKTANLQRIAEEFGVSFEWLTTGRGDPLNGALTTSVTKSVQPGPLPIRGVVEAGSWQDVESWGAEDMPEYVPSAGEYPLDWQMAFVIHGESVNRTARDGEQVVCLDLIKSGVDIQHDDLVIVERSRFGGQMIERTAKRVRQTASGIELWPDSTHPEHQTPIAYRPNGDPEHNSVRIIAKVIWVLRRP